MVLHTAGCYKTVSDQEKLKLQADKSAPFAFSYFYYFVIKVLIIFISSSRFCLDNQHSLDRDQAFVKLQSRLIRYETQTTCSKEPCALPFALSPAPSPAVMSEPGSVPDGETLQNADVARLKRRSRDTDIIGGYPHKRYDDQTAVWQRMNGFIDEWVTWLILGLWYAECCHVRVDNVDHVCVLACLSEWSRLVKSESSDSLCSQSSNSSGTHPALRSLRQQPSRSQSTSSSSSPSATLAARRTSSSSGATKTLELKWEGTSD